MNEVQSQKDETNVQSNQGRPHSQGDSLPGNQPEIPRDKRRGAVSRNRGGYQGNKYRNKWKNYKVRQRPEGDSSTQGATSSVKVDEN